MAPKGESANWTLGGSGKTLKQKGRRWRPKGKLGRTVIVLPGVHCCADFFSIVDGKAVWNRNWSVEYNGVLKEYWKGDPCGNVMAQAQVLKKSFSTLL